MTYQLTDEELRTYNGTTLKIYIVLNNSPDGMTARAIAALLEQPPSSVYLGITELRKNGIIFQNSGIFSINREKIPFFGKEKEKNQKKKENVKSSTTTSPAQAREDEDELFSWLTDSDEYLQTLAMRNGIDLSGGLIDAYKPYIEEFTTLLKLRDEDIYLKGRSDVKSHFASWLPKYIRATEQLNQSKSTKYDNDYKTANTSRALDPEPDISAYNIKWD